MLNKPRLYLGQTVDLKENYHLKSKQTNKYLLFGHVYRIITYQIGRKNLPLTGTINARTKKQTNVAFYSDDVPDYGMMTLRRMMWRSTWTIWNGDDIYVSIVCCVDRYDYENVFDYVWLTNLDFANADGSSNDVFDDDWTRMQYPCDRFWIFSIWMVLCPFHYCEKGAPCSLKQ